MLGLGLSWRQGRMREEEEKRGSLVEV